MTDWNFFGGVFLPIEGEEDTQFMLLRAIPHILGLLGPLGQVVVHRHLSSNVFSPSHVLVPSAARGSRSAALFLSAEISRDQAGRNTSLTTGLPLIQTDLLLPWRPGRFIVKMPKTMWVSNANPGDGETRGGREIGDSEVYPWRASLMSSPFQTPDA